VPNSGLYFCVEGKPVEVALPIPKIKQNIADFIFPDASEGDWFVLHTKSRQERVVIADLSAMGIGHYLPLVRQTRYYGKRKTLVELPLFPGYIFLRGTIDDTYLIDRTKRIAQIIPVALQERLDWELRNLHMALTQEAPLAPYPYLKIGMRVEVRSGPFKGLQGVIENSCENRLILQVDLLGRAVSLELDGALLDLLD
jgi:transcription termination/antitermination protein NusG